MQIITEPDFSGVDKTHRWAAQFQILNYSQGSSSSIPHGFFRNWLDQSENINGTLYCEAIRLIYIESIGSHENFYIKKK